MEKVLKLIKSDFALFIAGILAILLGPGFLKKTTNSVFFGMNGDSDAAIATAVNGFTAPIIGIVTAILLYRTLNEQIKVSKRQNADTKIQMILDGLSTVEYFSSKAYLPEITKITEINGRKEINISPEKRGVDAIYHIILGEAVKVKEGPPFTLMGDEGNLTDTSFFLNRLVELHVLLTRVTTDDEEKKYLSGRIEYYARQVIQPVIRYVRDSKPYQVPEGGFFYHVIKRFYEQFNYLDTIKPR